MAKVPCLYCAAEIPDDSATCPACGAPSHDRNRGNASGNIRKFIIFFVLLVLVSIFFMLWLPR
ncbi:MAG: zinc ribbon domain-containing protein [Gammaproteobacteria bacterium]|nr:zinc ribbon domain-containing protein [Gammaproteobacteria bacterium]